MQEQSTAFLTSTEARSVQRIRAWICCGLLSLALTLIAEASAATDSGESADLQEVIVTGTRQSGLEASESPVPVQILSAAALETAAASPDLLSALSQIVPSLTMQAFGEDMANNTVQAKLRGLSPNHVLVLVNGKRRHTTANLAVDITSVYQGGAGADLNFIPLAAIDHIEVLTQGAAAQYGSDAIAGVINIILKNAPTGGNASATYGMYWDGGGNTGDVSGNLGFEPYSGSFVNVTGEVHNHGHSFRGGIDERVLNPANLSSYPGSNIPQIADYPFVDRTGGDAESHLKLASVNAGFDLAEQVQLYGTATYGDKNASSFENYRLPTKVSFTDPQTGQTTYPFPFGFEPTEYLKETDYALSIGLRGVLADWHWDLSGAFGADAINLYTLNSANAGLYALTGGTPQRDFYDGRLEASQETTTIDINRDFDVGLSAPLNFAFGGEYRRDTYRIGAGIPSSYLDGGAQSYPGFTPTDAGSHDRKNEAVYLDLAMKPLDALRIDAAGRYEHFSDFGNAVVGKLTARYDFTSAFAVRGTVNNGFRAPTLAEEYYSTTNVGPITAFVQLPPNSPGGKLLGLGDGLQAEKSTNCSLGIVFRPSTSLSATLDFYQINVKNRIVGSGQLVGANAGTILSPTINAAIAANGNQLDPQVVATGETGINVFANGIDTRTRGADLVLNYEDQYAFGRMNYSVGATFNQTTVTRIRPTPPQLGTTPLFDATALSDLTTASPKYVIDLGARWSWGKASIDVLEKIYGPSAEYENDDFDNPTGNLEYFKSTIGVSAITDLDLGFQFTQHLKVSAGATNLLNRYPNKLNRTLLAHYNDPAYGDNAGILVYPFFSPYGINGGFWYAKAVYSF